MFQNECRPKQCWYLSIYHNEKYVSRLMRVRREDDRIVSFDMHFLTCFETPLLSIYYYDYALQFIYKHQHYVRAGVISLF
jgi:hypothetical protein